MPYGIETDVAMQVSEDGDVAASFEGEYDLRLTQRLYLQPRTEIAVAASEVEEFGVGEGLNSVRAGLRLGYEVTRRFAPISVLIGRKSTATLQISPAQVATTRKTLELLQVLD